MQSIPSKYRTNVLMIRSGVQPVKLTAVGWNGVFGGMPVAAERFSFHCMAVTFPFAHATCLWVALIDASAELETLHMSQVSRPLVAVPLPWAYC
jgi:hypothetical protein